MAKSKCPTSPDALDAFESYGILLFKLGDKSYVPFTLKMYKRQSAPALRPKAPNNQTPFKCP